MTDILERLLALKKFLNGEDKLHGKWWGDFSARGPYAWRRHLSAMDEAAAEITRLRADREAVIRECAAAARSEMLIEDTGEDTDESYNLGIDHAITAILALIEQGDR